MPLIVKLSQDVQSGDNLVNLGVVTTVDPYPASKVVRLAFYSVICQSAAFFWYRYDVPLTLQVF